LKRNPCLYQFCVVTFVRNWTHTCWNSYTMIVTVLLWCTRLYRHFFLS